MLKPRRPYDVLGCGATVVSHLGDPDQDPLKMLITLLQEVNVRFTFYIMADAQPKKLVKNTSGVKLKNYIEEHKLGPMIETPGRHFSDINGPNYIKMYVWRPDYNSVDFKKWATDNNIKCIPKMY